jgi:hypothetical protein
MPPSRGGCSLGPKTSSDLVGLEVHRERKRRKHVTLQLLHLEYRAAHPEGLSYTQFCVHYRRWRARQDVVMRLEYAAGERMFVDFAGDAVPVTDPETGEIWNAQVFVSVLGASGYPSSSPHRTCHDRAARVPWALCLIPPVSPRCGAAPPSNASADGPPRVLQDLKRRTDTSDLRERTRADAVQVAIDHVHATIDALALASHE